MNTYRILYTWQQRDYFTVMQHISATKAIAAAQMQIMMGARVYAVELA